MDATLEFTVEEPNVRWVGYEIRSFQFSDPFSKTRYLGVEGNDSMRTI